MKNNKAMDRDDMILQAKSNIKASTGDKILNWFFCLFIIVFAVACIIPLILVISASFTDEATLNRLGYSLIPHRFSFDAYKLVFSTEDIPRAYAVTLFITAVGTFLSLAFSCSIAYPMSVKNFRNRGRIALFLYFTMLFNGGLVSSYLLIKKFLHIDNTILVLMLPSLCNAWNILLMRNFFNGVPDSLAESAKLDGANDFRILISIILPVSKPALATIGLFYALSYWNEWYKCMLYIDSSHDHLYTLQYLIQRIMRKIAYAANLPYDGFFEGNLPTYSFRMAAIVVTIGPIVLLYPFLQKYFVKGLTVGSIKG